MERMSVAGTYLYLHHDWVRKYPFALASWAMAYGGWLLQNLGAVVS
jgi:hypothetical protein